MPASVWPQRRVHLRTLAPQRASAQSPCRGVDLPRIERDEMRFLTPSEIGQLAEAIDPRYQALILLASYGGLQLGELAGLRRAQVDPDQETVRVIENAVEVRGHIVRGAPKTRAGRRTVPLAPTIAAALRQHVDRYGVTEPDAPVFAGPHGGTLWAGAWRSRFWTPA
ncbi:MAG: site-specific integrase, partial [Acidimicrobiales bacterium]